MLLSIGHHTFSLIPALLRKIHVPLFFFSQYNNFFHFGTTSSASKIIINVSKFCLFVYPWFAVLNAHFV